MTNPNFFAPPQPIKLGEIAQRIGAELSNGADPELEIVRAEPIETAGDGAITFLDNISYLPHLKTTKAGAVICNEKFAAQAPEGLNVMVHPQPYHAYGQVLHILYPSAGRPQPITSETGISTSAHVEADAIIEDGVLIEAGCVIGSGASIGTGSQILAGAIIGADVQIGRNSTIGSNATIIHSFIGDDVIIHSGVSIGQDGFGFAMGPGGHAKVPQVGRVIVQDKVEIGANTAIDRGANRDTVIGEGTKIDNLVQIGHNVVIGRHCVIVGLVGISGSATLGDFVVVAGQAGIVGHITIGSGAQIGGGSGVHRDIEPGEKVMGYPSIPADLWMRNAAKTVREAKKWRKHGKGK